MKCFTKTLSSVLQLVLHVSLIIIITIRNANSSKEWLLLTPPLVRLWIFVGRSANRSRNRNNIYLHLHFIQKNGNYFQMSQPCRLWANMWTCDQRSHLRRWHGIWDVNGLWRQLLLVYTSQLIHLLRVWCGSCFLSCWALHCTFPTGITNTCP